MKAVEMHNLIDDIKEAQGLLKQVLKRGRVSDLGISETMLIFEALCHNIFEQAGDEGVVVTVKGVRRFGSTGVVINYEGERFTYEDDPSKEQTPEDKILNAYADRIDYTYRGHFNSIRIHASRSYVNIVISHAIALALALLVYTLLHFSMDLHSRLSLFNDVVFPFEKLFANAMLMVGAPVTFLSLLRNLTGVYILSEKESRLRKLMRMTISSSIVSVLLAVLCCQVVRSLISLQNVPLLGYDKFTVHMKFSYFVSTLLPSDIFTPFQTLSPFPLIVFAVLVIYAFCSVGKYFDSLMQAINVAYALFSRMLSIVIFTLPIFTFFAIMDLLLRYEYAVIKYLAMLVAIVLLSLLVLVFYYALRLITKGVPVIDFARKLRPLLAENFKIASVIDAVPFNIRYCVKTYGFDRKRTESTLPVLAQVNLDGNCFLITLISVIFMCFCGSDVIFADMLLIALLVFVLSLGSPNQPGSVVIGILIILHFINANSFIPFAIFSEVFFGGLQNLVNVSGDIVTQAICEKQADEEATKN